MSSTNIRFYYFAFFLLGLFQNVNAQFFAELTNPKVKVSIDHPSGLEMKMTKVIFQTYNEDRCSNIIKDKLIRDFIYQKVQVLDENMTFKSSKTLFEENVYKIEVKVNICKSEIKNDLISTEKVYNSKTKSYDLVKNFVSRTSVFLNLSIQTKEYSTGKIIAAKVYDYSPFLETKSPLGIPDAPSENAVQELALNYLIGDINRLYFPWRENTFVTFFNDKEGDLITAYKELRSGNYKKALDISKQNLQNSLNSNFQAKTISRAYYNLGVCYMIKGDYENSLIYLTEGQKINKGSIFRETIADCIRARDFQYKLVQIEDNVVSELSKMQLRNDQKFTNKDVVLMVKNKIPISIIKAKILASDCNFSLSTTDIVDLLKSGVGEDIINSMLEKK